MPALTALMRDIAARRIRIVEVETATPSPFGKSLLFRYVGAFMYEGDAPLAERRAQALSLDPALLAELLGHDGLRELLDPAVVAETERDLQHLSEARRCRDLEGVADLLRTAGPLTAAEVAARCVDGASPDAWLAELAAARRAIEVRVAGQPMWAAIEDAGRLRDALGVPLPLGVPEAFTEPVADPLGDLVARYARTHGPFAAAAVAGRYGLGVAVVTMALRRQAADGRVVEGEFLPARDPASSGSLAGAAAWSGATPRCCACCGAAAWPGCARRPSRYRPRCWPGSCLPGTGSADPRLPAPAAPAPGRRGGGPRGGGAAGRRAGARLRPGDAGAARAGARLLPRPARRADLGRRGGLVRRRGAARRRRLAGARARGRRAADAARAGRGEHDPAAYGRARGARAEAGRCSSACSATGPRPCSGLRASRCRTTARWPRRSGTWSGPGC